MSILYEDIKHAKNMGIVFSTLIGTGGFSDVYCAVYKDNKVALKVLYKDRCDKDIQKQELIVSQILKETTHKNVTKFIDTFDNSNQTQTWILMDWINGKDMHKVLKQQKCPFEETLAKNYFKQMVEGLGFLHSNNIVHRDIKPHNILIGRTSSEASDVIKYIDFGFAKVVTLGKDNKAICSSHIGSQIYMAPELMSKKQLTYDAFKTDIYSLAIVLYEMLFNVLPFGSSDFGCDRKERNSYLQKLKENLILKYPEEIDVSESAKDLIENMICNESEKRLGFEEIMASKWLQNL